MFAETCETSRDSHKTPAATQLTALIEAGPPRYEEMQLLQQGELLAVARLVHRRMARLLMLSNFGWVLAISAPLMLPFLVEFNPRGNPAQAAAYLCSFYPPIFALYSRCRLQARVTRLDTLLAIVTAEQAPDSVDRPCTTAVAV